MEGKKELYGGKNTMDHMESPNNMSTQNSTLSFNADELSNSANTSRSKSHPKNQTPSMVIQQANIGI